MNAKGAEGTEPQETLNHALVTESSLKLVWIALAVSAEASMLNRTRLGPFFIFVV